jgi:hypothetical protein
MATSLVHASSRTTAAACLIIAIVAGGCASAGSAGSSGHAGSSASADSSGPAGSQTFVSERYGFSIELPPAASPRRSAANWDASCLCGLANPAWDVALVDGRTWAIGATPVDATIDLQRWQAKMFKLAPAPCTDSAPPTKTAIGGEDALAWTATCSDGNAIKLAVLHGGRGYMMLFDSPTDADWKDNWEAFNTLTGSFRFEGS